MHKVFILIFLETFQIVFAQDKFQWLCGKQPFQQHCDELNHYISESIKSINQSSLNLQSLQKILNTINNYNNHVHQDDSQDIVILLGNSGVGKSTLINYLGNIKLIGYKDGVKNRIKADQKQIADIGQNFLSETILPQKIKVQDITIWDLPGLEDNRGVEQDIINTYYIKTIIESSSSIKVVYLIDFSVLFQTRNSQLQRSLIILDELFSSNELIYQNCLSIVITQVLIEKELTDVKYTFIQMIKQMNFKNSVNLIKVIQESVSLFHELQPGKYSTEDNKNQFMQMIQNKKSVQVDKLKIAPSISQNSIIAAIKLNQFLTEKCQKIFEHILNFQYQKFQQVVENRQYSFEQQRDIYNSMLNNFQSLSTIETVSQMIHYFQNESRYCENLKDILNLMNFLNKITDDEQQIKDFWIKDYSKAKITALKNLFQKYEAEKNLIKMKEQLDKNNQKDFKPTQLICQTVAAFSGYALLGPYGGIAASIISSQICS